MKTLNELEVWLTVGSQHLYGEETLKQVAANAGEIANTLDNSSLVPVRVKFKPVLTSPEAILDLCQQADRDPRCIGLITWMHTFSPARMWINGLKVLTKPLVHLHTQYNRDIPWDSIDMNFMNLNQSAHGCREYGHILSRMRRNRKVIVGYWKDIEVQKKLSSWIRAAAAWHDWQGMKIARFGDNMRDVAVTEGDKVEAQLRFGFSVNGYGIGDLAGIVNGVTEDSIDELIGQYEEEYNLVPVLKKEGNKREYLRDAARIESGMRSFLQKSGFKAFTTTFEDLHGLKQLPGLAVQRLMAGGYGFGAEGDWKTAALVRAMKVMSHGLEGGTSFMEDYTYNLDPSDMKVLGAHMLEVCPSISKGKPSMEIHPLSIGGKADPVRLVFDVPEGRGLNVSLVDMGNRFRMIVNPCRVVSPEKSLPMLPVARALWIPEPDLPSAACAWIHAGGAHHTGFSMAVTTEMIEDFSDIADMELLVIDEKTNIREFKKEIRWNDLYYHLDRGLKY